MSSVPYHSSANLHYVLHYVLQSGIATQTDKFTLRSKIGKFCLTTKKEYWFGSKYSFCFFARTNSFWGFSIARPGKLTLPVSMILTLPLYLPPYCVKHRFYICKVNVFESFSLFYVMLTRKKIKTSLFDHERWTVRRPSCAFIFSPFVANKIPAKYAKHLNRQIPTVQGRKKQVLMSLFHASFFPWYVQLSWTPNSIKNGAVVHVRIFVFHFDRPWSTYVKRGREVKKVPVRERGERREGRRERKGEEGI